MPRIAFQGTQLSYKSWNFFNNVHNILHNYSIVFAANLITSTLLYAWCWIHVLVAKAKDSRMDIGNPAQVRSVWRSSCCKQPYGAHTKNLTLSTSTRSTTMMSSRHHHTYICDIDNKHEDHILKKSWMFMVV